MDGVMKIDGNGAPNHLGVPNHLGTPRKDIWSECLAELNFSYNTSIHQGLRTFPFEVVYNYQPRYPGFKNLDGLRETF